MPSNSPRRHWGPYLLAAPAVLFLTGMLAGPLLLLVRVSLYEPARGRGFYRPGTWTADNLTGWADAYGRAVTGFTVRLGVGVAGLSLLIAYPLALFVDGLPPRWKAVALAAVLAPKLTNLLVLLFGLQLVLSADGPVNAVLVGLGLTPEPLPLYRNLFGVVVGETYLILPYAVLVLVVGLGRTDPTLVPAARGLGATRWQAFRRVTLPLSAPDLAAAGTLSLVWGLGAFLGPVLLGGPDQTTLAAEVHRQAFEQNNWPRGAAAGVVLLLTIAACLAAAAAAARFRKG